MTCPKSQCLNPDPWSLRPSLDGGGVARGHFKEGEGPRRTELPAHTCAHSQSQLEPIRAWGTHYSLLFRNSQLPEEALYVVIQPGLWEKSSLFWGGWRGGGGGEQRNMCCLIYPQADGKTEVQRQHYRTQASTQGRRELTSGLLDSKHGFAQTQEA